MKANMKILPQHLGRATVVALALAAGITAGRADYKSTVLGDSPLGYWRFSEAGLVTPDINIATNLGSAGVNSDGAYYQGQFDMSTVKQQPGALATDKAAHFDGATQNVLVQSNSIAATIAPPFTVEAWVKPDAVPTSGSFNCPVASIWRPSPQAEGWIIYEGSSGWNLRLGDATGYGINITGGMTPVTNTWYHLMATYDGTNAVLYVNGASAATGTSNLYAPNTTVPMGIGSRGDNSFWFPGSVDEVAVYPSVLPASAAAAHHAAATTNAAGYAAQILASHPVGYWRLDEPLFPLPVATNSGTLGAAANGGYVYWSATELDLDSPTFPEFETNNTVLQLDGTNGGVEIPPLNLNTNTVTIEAWVYLNGVQSPWSGLVVSRDFGFGDGLNLGSDGQELSYTWNQNNADTYNFTSGLEIPLNEWSYVALAIDPNQARLFLGTAEGWEAATNAIAHDSEGFPTNSFIGEDPSARNRFIIGEMDEVAIYNKTLTEGQLHTHALAGLGSTNPPALVTDPPLLTPGGVIYATTPFSLIADAFGQPPLSFQWRLDTTNIPGATALSYGKLRAAAGDGGSYDVVVSNASGAVTSLETVVTINPAIPPTITNAPQSQLVYAGGTAAFSVGAEGTVPLSYQWTHATTNLPGATNTAVIISGVDAAKAGSYAVIVTNVAGSVTSSPVTLSLLTAAAGSYAADLVAAGSIGYWPLDEASGTTAFDYFGGHDGAYSNGVTLGAPGPLLGVSETAAIFDGASGYVQIPQSGTLTGSALTNVTQATFICWLMRNGVQGNYKGLLAMRPPSTGLYLGGDDNLNYSWNNAGNTYGFESGLLPPDGQWTLAAVVVQPTQAIFYMGSYSNGFVSVTNPVTHPPADFTAGPIAIGTDINYGGTDNRYFNGSIGQAAIFTNALTGSQIYALFNAGVYGAATPPFVITQPAAPPAEPGASVTISVLAGGSIPLSYQWQKGGTPIAGATASSFTLSNVYYTDAASYAVVISNSVNAITSAPAVLTVMPPPTFANLTNGLVLHLTFDGNYLDSSGRTNDAAAIGAPAFISGRLGEAIHLSSSPETGTNYLTISDTNGDLSFGDTDSFSVSFWLRFTNGFNDLPIIGDSVNSTYQPGWVMTEDNNQFEWTLVGVDVGGTIADPTGGPLINDGAWHQIVAVFDRTSGMGSSFVDGVKVDSRSIASVGNLITGYPLTMGQDPTGAYGVAGAFDVDDLGIWRRALSDYEAVSIYAAGQFNDSFNVYGPVKLSANHVGTNIDVAWQAGTLQQSTNLSGPYSTVTGASAPFYRTTAGGSAMFFRLKQ
jgi:hypothetical protein